MIDLMATLRTAILRSAHPIHILAALTAAGYAVVKLPEGVTVEHGSRLVAGAGGTKLYNLSDLYAIEPPEKGTNLHEQV